MNEQLVTDGKQPAKVQDLLLGVTKASLSTDSWLSASSFQHTIKVLAGAAIGSTTDPLYGLKENVIIGKLLPAGTGFVPGRFAPTAGRWRWQRRLLPMDGDRRERRSRLTKTRRTPDTQASLLICPARTAAGMLRIGRLSAICG